MVVADDRQREMPTDDDRDIHRGHAKALAYKEAVQLVRPHNLMFKNQVTNLVISHMFGYFGWDKYLIVHSSEISSIEYIKLTDNRWMISTSTHVRSKTTRCTVGSQPSPMSAFGSFHQAVNTDLVDRSNRSSHLMLVLRP